VSRNATPRVQSGGGGVLCENRRAYDPVSRGPGHGLAAGRPLTTASSALDPRPRIAKLGALEGGRASAQGPARGAMGSLRGPITLINSTGSSLKAPANPPLARLVRTGLRPLDGTRLADEPLLRTGSAGGWGLPARPTTPQARWRRGCPGHGICGINGPTAEACASRAHQASSGLADHGGEPRADHRDRGDYRSPSPWKGRPRWPGGRISCRGHGAMTIDQALRVRLNLVRHRVV